MKRRNLHRQLNPPVAGTQPVSGSLRVAPSVARGGRAGGQKLGRCEKWWGCSGQCAPVQMGVRA